MRFFQKVAAALGYEKVKERKLGKREFDAAAINRLTNDWTSSSFTMDSEMRVTRATLVARARDLVANNPYAQKFITMLHTNVLGSCGINLTMKAKDPDRVVSNKVVPGLLDTFANKIISDAWYDFGRPNNCTVTRRQSWSEVQKIALSSIGTDGECVVRLHRGFDNDHGFALQLIESDFLDVNYNLPAPRSGMNRIRMGVEINDYDEPVAYWMFTKSPNDSMFATISDQYRERVAANEIVHPYLLKRIGQSRGLPWMTPAMLKMKMLGGYEESAVVAARLGAAKSAFLTKTQGDNLYSGEPSKKGKYMDAEPGSIEELPAGLDVKTIDWQYPHANYSDFVKATLRGLASALNVSYFTLANDLEAVNFSSSRIGLQDERAFWITIQEWLATHFHDPIFSAWLEWQLMTGNINLPLAKFDKFNAPVWQGRRWDWVDPTKEVTAKIMQLNSGLTSITRILSEQGIDRDELFDEIADDRAAMEARDLEFSEIMPPPEVDPTADTGDGNEPPPDAMMGKAIDTLASRASEAGAGRLKKDR